MNAAQVYHTVDTNYKQGAAICDCGWHKKLGKGFNVYHFKSCPSCDEGITTRNQRKVITGTKENYTVTLGEHIYFVLSNGIHIQYSSKVTRRYTGLSLRKADNLR
jgi:hypothetical protein